jgi:magnesium chelatase subunit H
MPKHTSVDNTPIKVVMIMLDNHMSSTVMFAQKQLQKDLPGLQLCAHAATDWANNPLALEKCLQDIAEGDIIFVSMLFVEDHINPILPALKDRREACDAMVAIMSATEVVGLTKVGRFKMGGKESAPLKFMKNLRGKKKDGSSDGASQMRMLRQLPKLLKFIPGSAQDLRAYFLTMQYWLSCSDTNLISLVRMLVDRYATGPRKSLKGKVPANPPEDYPDTGLYHPSLKSRMTENAADIPVNKKANGTVGLVLIRAYVLAGDTGHYDGVIASLEARGINVLPIFACGLDIRPAVDDFLIKDGKPIVDAIISLTGFSLVGGPAYCNPEAAAGMLGDLDVPYISAQALEFQTLDQWQESDNGLLPIEATMMVALPELDGATGSMVFGGRGAAGTSMVAHPERAALLAGRIEKLVSLRRKKAQNRKVAIVLFNFPPNAGATGTAAHLDVFGSLFNTMKTLKADGYDVEIPKDVEALRQAIIAGNASTYGSDANVAAHVSIDDHVRREPWLDEIEAAWGSAPGTHQTDGRSLFVFGAHFGNVFVGVQPAFGYEGDPMRLLFEKGFAPTHAFAAFYRYIRDDFGADAALHFGTHGALEFMPGKQTGLSSSCWPERLVGDLPNFYLYASNNPSEGMVAKRRSAATLISYLTPPLRNAGLYNELTDLKASVDRWRACDPKNTSERSKLATLIHSQAAALELVEETPAWDDHGDVWVPYVAEKLFELEETLIPEGLHIVGKALDAETRNGYLAAIAAGTSDLEISEKAINAISAGKGAVQAAKHDGVKAKDPSYRAYEDLVRHDANLTNCSESAAILKALDGQFIPPVTGGDLIRSPEILPTGRNIHGFDPFKIPSRFAIRDGAEQAARLIDRHLEDHGKLPETVAMVLWGTDNLKSEGGPIAQALALMGARPRLDSFNRIAGAELIPLKELGRPRIDVVMTMSGIFRDLLPLQMRMLADAAYLAATADEPELQNYVRRNALKCQEREGCDIETAALRVFSNGDGAYGANLNHMVENSAWDDEEELGDLFTQRKSFGYTRTGEIHQNQKLFQGMLGSVDAAYQNLDGVETGVTTLDQYFDSLGGIARAASKENGTNVPVYIGDQTRSEGTVRSLGEQVALETRTRALNPAWFEGMLKHGYEGVRQIEAHITNTVGWSATTGQVDPWVYRELTETFMLDPEMRERLAELNSKASVAVANRLLEAHERNYWTPDEETLEALRTVSEELEDRLEGVEGEIAA